MHDAVRDAPERTGAVRPRCAAMMHTHEAAFETVIERHLLANGYARVDRDGFDRERAIFPETVLAFIPESHRFQIPAGCHRQDVRETPVSVGRALDYRRPELEAEFASGAPPRYSRS